MAFKVFERLLSLKVFNIPICQGIEGNLGFLFHIKNIVITALPFGHLDLRQITLCVRFFGKALHHPLALGVVIVYLPYGPLPVTSLPDCGHVYLLLPFDFPGPLKPNEEKKEWRGYRFPNG
jgi:hypothetical protein